MKPITIDMLDELAALFADVFNAPPWNDGWSVEQARARLLDIINTPKFCGMAEYSRGKIIGLIMGRGQQYFDGVHFEILEFCVARELQGQGIGRRMLNEFTEYLQEQGVCNAYLLTMKGQSTEGFYQKNGFKTNESMCLMSGRLN